MGALSEILKSEKVSGRKMAPNKFDLFLLLLFLSVRVSASFGGEI